MPLWYRAALEAVQTLEAHINGLQQETRAAIEKSFRLDREHAALRAQLARKNARLREIETGLALPTASMEEADRKWLITFADTSAECRDSIQIGCLLGLALIVSGCAGSAQGASTRPHQIHAALAARGVSSFISYPTSWHFRRETGLAGTFSLMLVTLSTGALPCAGWALELQSLFPHETLIRWSAYGFPNRDVHDEPGKHLVIDARPARLDIHADVDRWDTGILERCPAADPATWRVTVLGR